MEIKVISPSSYCFGVKRAIDIVNKICDENEGKNIFLFGELIHNKEAMKPLLNRGVKVVEFDKNTAESLSNAFKLDDIVIFSAHGHDKKYEEILKAKGICYFDATCPIVNLNLKKIEESKEDIIFVGKDGHPETMASLSRSQNIYLYDVKKAFDYSVLKESKVKVMNQTTLSFLELEDIFKNIKQNVKDVSFTDEICNASRIRQEKMVNLDNSYDLVLIIGDKNSSNTTKLYEISNQNKNHDTYFISALDELANFDFSKYKKCAIFSGTSCPKELIDAIEKKMREIYGTI